LRIFSRTTQIKKYIDELEISYQQND
jgi:hypothetical protein